MSDEATMHDGWTLDANWWRRGDERAPAVLVTVGFGKTAEWCARPPDLLDDPIAWGEVDAEPGETLYERAITAAGTAIEAWVRLGGWGE